MMTRISTVTFEGIEARPVEVQVQISSGSVAFVLVGLPDKAVAESRERVRSALTAAGLGLPAKRIVVNLAPASLPKEGSHFDLPIALGIMAAIGAAPSDALANYTVLGELALDSSILSVRGVLPAAFTAIQRGHGLICPRACGPEAVWAGEALEIIAAESLVQIANHFKGTQVLTRPEPGIQREDASLPDLRDVRGQESVRRALEIAAAGGHNLLMSGPPGSGKSMLAQRLPSILPPLDPRELLEISMIHSVAGLLGDGKIADRRPFRAPHHSASMAALVGGGNLSKPGEISLSHNGVLFLDELPEFQPHVLDALRQPLETGEILVARANSRALYPARFQLVAAMNPCRCGRAQEPGYACRRAPNEKCMSQYQARISGPLMDRFDLLAEAPAAQTSDLMNGTEGESSAVVAARVMKAREIQKNRYAALNLPIRVNAAAPVPVIEKIVTLPPESKKLLQDASEKLRLTARGFYRLLRVSRTLADLENEKKVGRNHLVEALSYRVLLTL